MSSDRNPIVDRYYYSLRFKTPYPFPEKRIINLLKEKGFDESKEPGRVFISASGVPVPMTVLRKGENEVQYNAPDGTIGVEGFEIDDVNKEMSLLTELITETLKIELKQIKFSEILARIRIESNSTAMKNIQSLIQFTDVEKIQEIGNDAMIYSFAICPKEAEESHDDLRTLNDWFHIRFVPFVPNPRYYLFDIVYRNKDVKKVEEFSNGLKDKLIHFIEGIEGE